MTPRRFVASSLRSPVPRHPVVRRPSVARRRAHVIQNRQPALTPQRHHPALILGRPFRRARPGPLPRPHRDVHGHCQGERGAAQRDAARFGAVRLWWSPGSPGSTRPTPTLPAAIQCDPMRSAARACASPMPFPPSLPPSPPPLPPPPPSASRFTSPSTPPSLLTQPFFSRPSLRVRLLRLRLLLLRLLRLRLLRLRSLRLPSLRLSLPRLSSLRFPSLLFPSLRSLCSLALLPRRRSTRFAIAPLAV